MSFFYKNNNIYKNDYINYFNKDYIKMEDTINHFKYWSEGFCIKKNFAFARIKKDQNTKRSSIIIYLFLTIIDL